MTRKITVHNHFGKKPKHKTGDAYGPPRLPNPKDYGEQMWEEGVEREEHIKGLAYQGLSDMGFKEVPNEWLQKVLAAYRVYKKKYPNKDRVRDNWRVVSRKQGFELLEGAGPDGGEWAVREPGGKMHQGFESRQDAEGHIASETADAEQGAGSGKRTTQAPTNSAPRYSAEAANKAIAASNRAGRKIGTKEASAIHRLLKGRHGDAAKDADYSEIEALGWKKLSEKPRFAMFRKGPHDLLWRADGSWEASGAYGPEKRGRGIASLKAAMSGTKPAKDAATLEQARAQLAPLGVVLTKSDGEYRVNFKGGAEATAYYTDDLNDAVGTGKAMAKHKASK